MSAFLYHQLSLLTFVFCLVAMATIKLPLTVYLLRNIYMKDDKLSSRNICEKSDGVDFTWIKKKHRI